MSRRRNGEDPEFGSDSFLDIIANIVGILIILIVVAGVKVANQPLFVATAQVNDEVGQQPVSEPFISRDQVRLLESETETATAQTQQLQMEQVELEKQLAQLTEESQRLKQKTTDTDVAIASYRQKIEQSDADHADRQTKAADVRKHVEQLLKQTAQEESRQQTIVSATRQMYDRQSAVDAKLKVIAESTRRLQELIEEQRAQNQPEVDRLEHRLSPVVRTVSDQELHFRLKSGRLSWVPIKPLLEHLKRQVSNRGDIIRRFGRYDGVCGPVSGYVMKYSIERQQVSPLDSLNGMSSGFRIAVSRWTVTPTDSLQAETVNDALKFGSRFRQVAEAADPDATMTVWLYPDEFSYFHKLREFGHGLGLRVAARPLPKDAVITGSPGGSRSNAQ